MPEPCIIYVVGSTGTGKSQAGLDICQHLRRQGRSAEIINADVMQMYAGLPVATNKLAGDEQEGVKHHFLGFLDPVADADWTVTRFRDAAVPVVRRLLADGVVPVVVGGTHYYVQALLFAQTLVGDGAAAPAADGAAPAAGQLADTADADLHSALAKVDPAMASKLHPNDHRRLRRSLEVYAQTGRPHSEVLREQARDELRFPDAANVVLWVDCEREVLNSRLDGRVDKMLRQGLLKEAKSFLADLRAAHGESWVPDGKGLLGAIGWKELLPHVAEGGALEPCLDRMKQATRRYAKQQQQWVRNGLCNRSSLSVFRFDSAPYSTGGLPAFRAAVSDRAAKLVDAALRCQPPGPARPHHPARAQPPRSPSWWRSLQPGTRSRRSAS
eukprot:TRINITY_DN8735_c0_g1_i2.p1 TRINITY_DN8735_c0_g1~~TRINITY_DN8735_c0_g1_i2.p1  ORF type:complete len:398 (+),score=130.31 TRINITY_DN8735_c0_g1_i2:40-1194(+)